MSLQDVSPMEAHGDLDYDSPEVTYAVIDEGQILQVAIAHQCC